MIYKHKVIRIFNGLTEGEFFGQNHHRKKNNIHLKNLADCDKQIKSTQCQNTFTTATARKKRARQKLLFNLSWQNNIVDVSTLRCAE